MAELLIQMNRARHPDEDIARTHLNFGDVVDVTNDGSLWGRYERTHTQVRLIRFPNISKDDLLHLLDANICEDNPDIVSTRKHHLDLDSDKISPDMRAYLDDFMRRTEMFVSPMTLDELLAIRITDDAMTDPNVIG